MIDSLKSDSKKPYVYKLPQYKSEQYLYHKLVYTKSSKYYVNVIYILICKIIPILSSEGRFMHCIAYIIFAFVFTVNTIMHSRHVIRFLNDFEI